MVSLTYELSPLRMKFENGLYNYVGLVRVTTSKGNRFMLPFGASHADKYMGRELAISELIERVTWANVKSSMKTKNTLTSVGYAAHVDLKQAVIHSCLERMEHILLQSITNGIRRNDVVPFCRKKNTVTWCFAIPLFGHLYYTIVMLYKGDGFLSYGMGSSDSKEDSFEKAALECNRACAAMRAKAVTPDFLSYHAYEELYTITQLLYDRVVSFVDLWEEDDSNDLTDLVPHNVDLGVLGKIRVFDVTNLCPSAFLKDRIVTCCIDASDKNVASFFLKNGGKEIAIEI